MSIVQFPRDLRSQAHKRAPDETFALLRRDHPVAKFKPPLFGEIWLMSRHRDVEMMLKDKSRFVQDPRNAGRATRIGFPRWLPKSIRSFESNMASVDEPDHQRLRGLVNQAFSRRSLDDFAATIERITDRLLDQMAGNSETDLVEGFCRPLPLTVISELLGVPEENRDAFRRWSEAAVKSSASLGGMIMVIPRLLQMRRHLIRMAEARRAAPADDLITAIVRAETDGDHLSKDEVTAMLLLLIIAGHETTVHSLGSGILALLENPDQKQLLIDEPGRIERAAEEIFRRETSVEFAGLRYAAHDIELYGELIAKGEPVMPVLISANYDEAVFENPERFDVTRHPNPHVTFGAGVHFCLGVQLARMEVRIALTKLLARFPDLELAVDDASLKWLPAIGLRGLAQLPVRLGKPA